jgi:hypothetical protein
MTVSLPSLRVKGKKSDGIVKILNSANSQSELRSTALLKIYVTIILLVLHAHKRGSLTIIEIHTIQLNMRGKRYRDKIFRPKRGEAGQQKSGKNYQS